MLILDNSPELAAGVQSGVHNVEGVLPPPAQTQQLGSVGVHSDPLHLAIIIIIIITLTQGIKMF